MYRFRPGTRGNREACGIILEPYLHPQDREAILGGHADSQTGSRLPRKRDDYRCSSRGRTWKLGGGYRAAVTNVRRASPGSHFVR